MNNECSMPGLIDAWRMFRSRSARDRRRLLQAAWTTVRHRGIAQTLAQAKRSAAMVIDRDAENRRYADWCRRHTPDGAVLATMAHEVSRWTYTPLLSILTPVYNTPPALLEACAESVLGQVYRHWEWQIADDGSSDVGTRAVLDRLATRDARITVHRLPRNSGVSDATNVALEAATGEYVGLLDHDDALLAHAAYRVVAHLNTVSERPDVVYSDEDKLEPDGTRTDAYFKPDWSPDLFLSNMYACHWLLARRTLVQEIGGFRAAFDFSQDYDLLLRLMERANRIDHVADVLYHWRKVPQSTASAGAAKPTAHLAGQRALQDYLDRNTLGGHVEDAGPPGFFRIVYDVDRKVTVSVIGLDLAAQTRLRSRTAYPKLEFVGSADQARGERLLFLDPALDPRDPGWLDALLQVLQPGVGVAGAKILRADGTLEHIGLVLGLAGVAGRPFLNLSADHPGYFGNAILIRNVSAVSGACLLTPRDVFAQVGGMDVTLGPDAGAIDYCLKVSRAGGRVVFTPWSVLQRREAAPVPALSASQTAQLREKWRDVLTEDPYYNPHLSREFLDYRVEG